MRNRLAAALDSFVTELKLPRAEWDFRALIHKKPTLEQRQELGAAIRYEYARESESVRKLADEFADLEEHQIEERGSLVSPKPAKLLFFTALPYWNCILWPKFFPRTPWLCIPPEERVQRVRSFVEACPPRCLEINELDNPPELELPNKGGRLFFDDTKENIILSIDWAVANNEEIISAFGKWVRNSWPPTAPEPRGDASRQNVSAAFLKRLAVARLLHHYPHREAVEIALDHELKMPRQQSNALRMRTRFRADLHKVFLADLFERPGRSLIPRDELPRCWITWSERRKRRHQP